MPIENVQVEIFDSVGKKTAVTTNCAGNFFVSPTDTPAGPLWVAIRRDQLSHEMDTAIYREGSCAGCHHDPQGPAAVGHVYIFDPTDPADEVPVSQCR
jgi:hypothetical protein